VNSPISGDSEPWAVEVHPGTGQIRVLVQPGVLLLRMLRRGTALPAARFSWRVVDVSESTDQPVARQHRPVSAAAVGEFSVLSNLEDAASTQPPDFIEYPLRREQLRSLGWMHSQERSRNDPFITELRESVPCPDAPHWRLEGRLMCEYVDVNGGVLADAIGYGKTACTIGLINYDPVKIPPQVPSAFTGFIPSRATLILVPTNLHMQWIAEIKKFTGKTLNVISVPTCTQLKRIPTKELMNADVVLATYRLFYSSAYLARLSSIARERRPKFKLPRFPGSVSGPAGVRRSNAEKVTTEWARAYREAFELLPAWASQLQGREDSSPVTPDRQSGSVSADETPAPVEQASSTRRSTGKKPAFDSQLAGDSPAKRRRLQGKQPSQADTAPPVKPDWADGMHYVPLEAFWWKRVVCDEFHELLGRYPPAQVAVELFHADYKWGLSGTPPCQTLAQIRKAAGFLGVQLPYGAGSDECGDAPRKVAQEWLDAYMRRNTIELPPLEEEERIIPVQQTPKERALYLALTEQQASHTPPEGFEEPSEIQAARQSAGGLLKLCSHFCPSGATDVLTAEDECARQLALRREQLHAVERDVRGLADRALSTLDAICHFEPHFCNNVDESNYGFLAKETRPRIVSRLKFFGANITGSKQDLLKRLFAILQAPGVPEDAKEIALRVDFNAGTAGTASELSGSTMMTWLSLRARIPRGSDEKPNAEKKSQHLMVRILGEASAKAVQERCPNAAPPRCARLRFNLGMPQWPGEVKKGSAAQKKLEEEGWEWMGDEVQAGSMRKVVSAWKQELERFSSRIVSLEDDLTVKMQSLQSFQETLHASQVSDVEVVAEPDFPQFAKYGSKIQSLVKHVQRLQLEDPQSKIICFVQWEDLNHKLSSALEEFGVQHLTLRGSVWARRAVLTRFQFEDDSPRLLLLSLQESASGTNLTAANHVIIMHPMEAATQEEAVAFEMQAVGRVRRPGQQRKIHIWRFVTVGTIEQKITEEHQKDLWERQRASLPILQPNIVDDGESCDEEEMTEMPDLDAPMLSAQPDISHPLHEDSATQVYHNITMQSDSATQAYISLDSNSQDGKLGGEQVDSESATQSYVNPPC